MRRYRVDASMSLKDVFGVDGEKALLVTKAYK